jgi:hypothetical protein
VRKFLVRRRPTSHSVWLASVSSVLFTDVPGFGIYLQLSSNNFSAPLATISADAQHNPYTYISSRVPNYVLRASLLE